MTFHRVAQNLYRCAPYGTYYAVWKFNGAKRRKSLQTSDYQTARKRLSEHMQKAHRLRAPGSKSTFGDLADGWKEVELAARDLKPKSLVDRLGNLKGLTKTWPGLVKTRAVQIDRHDVERWKARRMHTISAQRFNNELDTLRQILGYGVRAGVLMDNPAEGVSRLKLPKTKINVLGKVDFQNLIERLRTKNNNEAAWMVELLAYSGMRLAEAGALTWDDVDFERDTFMVTGGAVGTKNREQRAVPLFPPLRDLLTRIPRMIGKTKVLSIKGCRGALIEAAAALKLPHVTHHSFRHFFVSNAIEAGIDFKAIAGWVGHKDGGLLVSRTYGHLRPEHSQLMASKMTYSAEGGQVAGTQSRAKMRKTSIK